MTGGWGTPSWMGGHPEPGEVFVNGKTPEVARALLAAAEDLGFDPIVVRTANGGFVVPDQVWDAVQDKQTAAGGEF